MQENYVKDHVKIKLTNALHIYSHFL